MVLDFLWRLRGSVALDPAVADPVVLGRIEQLLSRQGKDIARRGVGGLSFNGPLWSIGLLVQFRSMYIFDRGRFWIATDGKGRRLRYRLYSRQLMAVSIIGAGMFLVIGWATEGSVRGLGIGGLAFAWLYGINFLPAAVRVPLAVRGAVRKARRQI
ncbi:MAG: hypothetical protein A2352_00150 [Caulobacterales bacterium RIFOXYB1_FULL_67_16]|jgi:hypothetical protein|nr:MAG: hypothetical protein A2352_00150 [Caulobacterales bacterium RIFOXYB1_FULL_67_16]